MAKSDGTVIINTEINTSGITGGTNDIKKALDKISDTMNDFTGAVKSSESTCTSAFAASASAVDDLASSADSASGKLGGLESAQDGLASSLKSAENAASQLDSSISSLGTEASNGERKLKGLGDAARDINRGNPAQSLKTDIQGIDTEATQANDTLQDMAATLQDIAESSKDAAESTSNISSMTAAVSAGTVGMQAVGDTIKSVGTQMFESFSNLENAVTNVNSYFGLTGDAAEEMGEVVQNVFETGVTDSLDEVANGVRIVKENLGDLNATDLTNITNQAITLEKNWGIDMNESMRGVNALMTNFGMTAQEAMDYLVVGTQNGLDKTNELGDNLSEYSGKFAQAGYSAEEYFQLLQNGLEGGAYNLDKVNDSINEVTTRLADGTIADSLGSFSAETQQLFSAWKSGGATQKDVINSIISDISNATSQQEALTLASIAFGTMGEDANMDVIMSLNTMGDSYSDVDGKAAEMWENSTTSSQTLQGAINTIKDALAAFGEELAPAISTVADFLGNIFDVISEAPAPLKIFAVALGAVTLAFTVLVPVIFSLETAMAGLNMQLLPVILIIAGIAAAITAIILIIQHWGEITEWLSGVWGNIKAVAEAVWTAISEFFVMLFTSISEFFVSVWTGIVDFFTGIWQGISETATTVFTAISDFFVGIWNGIKETAVSVWNWIVQTVTGIWNNMKNGVTSIFNSIRNVITNVWNEIKDITSRIWNGIWGAIKSVVNSIIGGINGMIRGIVSGLNAVIRVLNKLNFKIPDWVPLLGGKRFGFNIKEFTAPQIPYLASGAVIPPNHEFMAVLGDQTNGTNLEAPESLLRKIVKEESNSNNEYRFIATINRRILFDEMIAEAKVRQTGNGKNPFVLA